MIVDMKCSECGCFMRAVIRKDSINELYCPVCGEPMVEEADEYQKNILDGEQTPFRRLYDDEQDSSWLDETREDLDD
jgi:uncharacterized Zn finger protein (UPF0148 family)